MDRKKKYIDLLKQFKNDNSEAYGITEIGIFGSVARGEDTSDSDVDVFVTMSHPNLLLLSGIKQDLESIFKKSVDVVRKHKHLSPVFLRNLERDAIYV